MMFGVVTNAVFQEGRVEVRRNGGRKMPEGRVRIGMVAGITFLINLFWFVWTGYESIRWIVSIPASTLRGCREFLYVDSDDIYLHGRLVQGEFSLFLDDHF